MSQKAIVDSDSTESDDGPVPPSPQAVGRSSRLLGRENPWSPWPPELIITTLEEAGIPVNTELSKDDLLQLAYSSLGSPRPTSADVNPDKRDPPAPTKQAGKKLTNKSSSPRPAKTNGRMR